MSEFSYDLLGRSLSGNPFFPKDVSGFLHKQTKFIKIIKSFDDFNPDDIYEAYLLSFINDEVSMLKRYSNSVILYNATLKDEKDLLKALVYGCDGVVLSHKNYNLSKTATHFGLSVIFEAKSKTELIKASFYKADIFYVSKNLFSSIPKNKIIISKDKDELVNGVII